MPRRSARLLVPVALAVLFFYVSVPSDSALVAPAPPPGGVDAYYEPFDTLLTDLSAYSWPVDPHLSTTSVFGDFRSTHFHAGVDISTGGREGYEVRAMRDGYVSFVQVSPSGYGKQLQIMHDDGFRTLYAHLSKFAPAIDTVVRAAQRRSGQYPLTLRPGPGRFRVSRGDVVAYTGSTGAGGPHLHFEIRDQNNNPLNPLLSENFTGLAHDRAEPVIEEVGFVPLRAATFIQGDTRPVYLRPIRRGATRYTLNTVVHVTGAVGLTARVRDGVGRREYRNRGVSLKLEIDSVLVFSSDIARVPSGDSKQIAIHYDWLAHSGGRSYHQKLFVDEGNRLPFYSRRPHGTGMFQSDSFARGYHTYTITATDIHGNRSTVTGSMVFNHPPEIGVESDGSSVVVRSSDATVRRIVVEPYPPGRPVSTVVAPGAGERVWTFGLPAGAAEAFYVTAENEFGTQAAGRWVPADTRKQSNSSLGVRTSFYRDFAYVSVSSSLPLTGRPSIKVLSGPIESDLAVRSLSAKRYFASFSLDLFAGYPIRVEAIADVNGAREVLGFDEFAVYPVTRERGATVLSPDGAFRLIVPPGGVFTDTYVRIEKETDGYVVSPDDVLLDRGATVEVDVPDALRGRTVGLFSIGGGDMNLLDWKPAGTGTRLSGRVSRFFGSYAVMEDDDGPVVGRVTFSYRQGWLRGSFTVHDNRAGVDAYAMRVMVGDRYLIPEYESENRRVRIEERIALARGTHHVVIAVKDQMDNASRYTVRVRVP